MAVELKDQVDELLTEEERAALEESDYLEGDDAGDDDDQADDTPDIDEQQRAAAAEGDEDDDQDDDPAAAQAQDDTPDADEDDQDDDAGQQQAPVALAQERQRLTTLQKEHDETQTAIKELRAAYQDGDFTDQEFDAEMEKLTDKLVEVRADAKQIERLIQQDAEAWDSAVKGYFKANPGLTADDDVLRAYDAAVRYVTQRFSHLPMKEQLAKAHRQLEFDAEGTPLAAKIPALKGAKPASKPTKPAKPARDDGMRTPPTTLARASATEVSGEADSALLQMQKLVESGDSDKIEAAYRKLTPEQRDAFSNMDF